MNEFQTFLIKNRQEKSIKIVFDIETLQYNEADGRLKPSNYKNVTYSFAIGYFDEEDIKVVIYPSSKHFFDEVIQAFSKWKKAPRIELIAHNTNKYDNHFLRFDLIHFYNLPVKNLYLKNATREGNVLTSRKAQLKAKEKEGLILEKRIKSSNNLELTFFINRIEFTTIDNYVKTNASIKTLGKKLLNLGLITEDDLKTDFNYTEFNKDYDMTDDEAFTYATKVFNNLTSDQLYYIRNDIIILAETVLNYTLLFKGFDYSKITFTSNILTYYNDKDLTSYQLLKSVGEGKDKKHLKYTDYHIGKENFYDYLKSFYAGGLNFYNDRLVGKILSDPTIAMDINSSYPYVMHNYNVPTFLKDYEIFENNTLIEIVYNDDFFLYRMDKKLFDYEIIDKIESRILRQILVKYYTSNDYVNINSYTLKMIENITGIRITHLTVLSYVSFECLPFASKDKIAEKYHVKTQGSSDKKVQFNDPYNIIETNEENIEKFSIGEIDISKVILNGLYGIPALRSHFNIFRWVADDLQNIPNGYENNERNIVFSVFVTAVSLYNLLDPLKYLTQQEIDKYFIYCDTDSLYLNKKVENKLSSNLFHKNHLGKWTMDHNNIKKFTVLNHKKYAYLVYDEKKQKDIIVVKSGGIPNDTFNFKVSFETFVKDQFSDNVQIVNQKSIYNKQGTISIYKGKTDLKKGSGYRVFSYDERLDNLKNEMMEEIRNSGDGSIPDLLYIESNLGSFSMSELFPHEHDIENKKSLYFLKMLEYNIRTNYLQID